MRAVLSIPCQIGVKPSLESLAMEFSLRRIQVRLRQKEEEWPVAIIWPQRVFLFSNSTREDAELVTQRKLISEGHQCDLDCGGWISTPWHPTRPLDPRISIHFPADNQSIDHALFGTVF